MLMGMSYHMASDFLVTLPLSGSFPKSYQFTSAGYSNTIHPANIQPLVEIVVNEDLRSLRFHVLVNLVGQIA